MTLIGTTADFSQRDGRWAGQLLGFAKWQTMGAYGCYVAAYANVAQANGKDVDPSQMNQLLKDKGLFSVDSVGEKSDISRSDALSVVFPDIKYVERKDWGTALADIPYFDVRGTTQTEIIVMIDYHPERSGIQMHFCRVIGINDAKNDVEIVDSYTGKRIWLSSLGKAANKLIYSAVKFQGPGSSNPSPVPAQQPATLPQDYVGKRVYLDTGNANVPVYQRGTNNIKGYLDPKNYESARSYLVKTIDSLPNRVGITSGLFGDVAVAVGGATVVK
jgi:hypothetical protein